jgi:hypothetical protein
VIQLEQFRKKKAAKKSAAAVEQAKPSVPDVVEKTPPIANTASSADGLVSDVEPNAASTSSASSAKYENGLISSSKVAESQSNGPVTVSASAGVSSISPQQDTVSDGGSKFYGNLSFSDLVNGHHENWRGNTGLKKDEPSPDKEVPSTSRLTAFGNTDSLGLPPSADTLPSWGRDSLSSQVRDTEQSSSYTSSNLFGRPESTYTQEYSRNNDIFDWFRGKFDALFSYPR